MECKIVSLDGQTWRIEEFDASNSVYLYLLAGTEKALLIDTGFGEIDLPAAVRSLTSLPVEVVNTHGHFDHIGGNGAFDQVRLHRADEALYHLHRQQPAPGRGQGQVVHVRLFHPIHLSVFSGPGAGHFPKL